MDKPITFSPRDVSLLAIIVGDNLSSVNDNIAVTLIKIQTPVEFRTIDFRFNVFSGKFPKIHSLCETGSDFYTTSEVRDLCFHYQEHQYRMDEIEQIINSNGLRFNGFLLKPEFKSLYANQYLDDKTQTNFKYLKEFEINYPQVFANTPPFWVSKV